ncbi:MAG TPA: TlpA disulfide reductase family protein [Saprospiraceae bacterium]|nr:TlpA disulfide reductase family protein [Saprospiraceae bacterium]
MKQNTFFFLILLALSQLLSACLVVDNPYSGLPPGPWRAVLKIDQNPVVPNPRGEPLPEKVGLQLEEITAGELPFNFEIIYPNPDSFYIEIINGEERMIVDDISIGRDIRTAKDTVFINFPVFDSYIRGIFVENIIEGEWVVRNRENYRIPFVAYHGRDHRFTNLQKEPITNVSGRWEVTFGLAEDQEPYPAIGDFKQEGNRVTGTFLTETGDYRFLEGTVQEDRLYLSVFDGSHAFLFGAKILSDSTMTGFFRSGSHYRTLWEAKRNPAVELRDPDDLTQLKEGYTDFDFSFENAQGQTVSLSDSRYDNKVTIVQVFGTWCPNCRDETAFLVDYLKKNSEDDLTVISLAFERHKDPQEAKAAINRYIEKMDIDYEILLAAANDDKAVASETLPMLSEIISYPTMIILDRNHKVRRIHTGFNGPATDKYDDFTKEFDTFIQGLLSEESQ